ncbi:hypothetical protein C0Q70_03372 [Pomacea canaliculata]|uniref:Cathepsin L n=1 Tax=Pomacea canaliculata TaxID=400727 RepID=A0A2T7PSM2_POMCA|nr:hypothetical protein C0Q70_03372 [Pomacea canaliculata]
MKCLLLLVTLGLTCSLDPDAEWETFKRNFHKVYRDSREETYRRSVFQTHLDFIRQHNLEADLGLYTFRVGVNEYADMTNEEFVRVMNGFRIPQNYEGTAPVYTPPKGLNPPASVDWRTKGYVTHIKNQGQCGSCWAFSATGSLEGQWFNKTKRLVSLSEQNLVDCSSDQGNKRGYMDNAFRYISDNKGIDTEASYPYKAKDGDCTFNPANIGATDKGLVDIKKGSEADLQAAVAFVGPISVAIDAGHTSFQLYKSGVYYEKTCGSQKEDLDHGVLAVGYGTQDSKDFWLVKNSWGTSWGMEGYIMMSRNRKNNCGIATLASYPVV